MSNELLASKVVIFEEEPKVRGIKAAATSVSGAIGIAERGPIGVAVSCTSLEDVQQVFGGFTPDSDLALAVKGFYENGGGLLWIVRTCHYTDVSDPVTATAVRAFAYITAEGVPSPARVVGTQTGPFRLANDDQLAIAEGGNPEDVIVFEGSAASIQAGGAGPFALSDGQTLTLMLEDEVEQTMIFNAGDFADIGNATSEELAAVINAQIDGGKALVDAGTLAIASDTEGLASRVQVTGGTANVALGFGTGIVQGTGNVERLQSVTVDEVKALVEAAVPEVFVAAEAGGELAISTVATGASASLQVGVSTAQAFGLDTDLYEGSDSGTANVLRVEGKDPGAFANRIEVEVKPPTSGEAGAFNLAITEDGVDRPGFPNLSMDPSHARYVEKIVNDERTGSNLIRVVDQQVAGMPAPDPQTSQLVGGDDGLSGLDDNDFIGVSAAKTGLYALNKVQDLSILFIPGRATPAMHNAMVGYCEVERDGLVFAVLDPPEGYGSTEIVDYVKSTAALQNLSENAAIYWPRVEILNPSKAVFGPEEKIPAPPSGVVCGIFARTDAARPGGVYDPPAGTEKGKMFGVLGFETDDVLEEAHRDIVYPERINPLTTSPGAPRFIDGSRTLKDDGQFPYVAEKRGVIFIRRSLKEGLRFARHKNNDESLRAQVMRTIKAFLTIQMNNSAFQSKDPKKAFFIEISDKPTDIMANKLTGRVGLAMNKATDWVVIGISADTRALDEELAG
jgi:uncharacterized protein